MGVLECIRGGQQASTTHSDWTDSPSLPAGLMGNERQVTLQGCHRSPFSSGSNRDCLEVGSVLTFS